MYEPKKENFTLKSMKSKDRASVEFEATMKASDGSEHYELPVKGPYPIIPHPDMLNLLDQLKVRLASAYGYTLFQSLVEGKNFSASKPQKKYAEQFT
jgi:hypothetical protein